MAENSLKTRLRRMLRSSLGSCKSKDQILDVAETHRSRQHYQLIELFSPQPHSFIFSGVAARETNFTAKKFDTSSFRSKLPFFSPDLSGRRCPPASPIISPLNSFYQAPKEKKKSRNKKKAYRKYSKFEDQFPECKYNSLFCNDEEEGEEDDDKRATVFSRSFSSTTTSRRTMEVKAAVDDSLAVVKRSSDPYSDFRNSMVEMIVEKQIFAAKDLENLLQCFLSLNSYHHHKIIIQVFVEVWEALL